MDWTEGKIKRAVLDRFKLLTQSPTKVNRPLCISLWHEFHKPPYGGGNQFMMALGTALEKLGVTVVSNGVSAKIDIHICNSAWFDVKKFSKLKKYGQPCIIHRVDGPIALYRNSSWDEDKKIYELNNQWATATVYQSDWCYQKMLACGFKPIRPTVIHNAVDGNIFHSDGRISFDKKRRKVRLISTAWSDNPRKGGPFYKALEDKLDWNRFEYTFVGRTQENFSKIHHIPAQDSFKLAEILRQHDIYIMASESEACSNALIEAMACGLPVIYLDDGGNGELTGSGGLPFCSLQEALEQLDRIVLSYDVFQQAIHVDSIEAIAKQYLQIAEDIRTLS